MLEHAADTGVAEAQYILGLMYATGHSVSENIIIAHMWFNLAAMQGVAEARDHRVDLALQMSPAEIAKAQRLAREWTRAH